MFLVLMCFNLYVGSLGLAVLLLIVYQLDSKNKAKMIGKVEEKARVFMELGYIKHAIKEKVRDLKSSKITILELADAREACKFFDEFISFASELDSDDPVLQRTVEITNTELDNLKSVIAEREKVEF